ncbi:MAG: hypothetical protein QNK03_15140 [Myxococcota bacterium]|nr:hypothetical protein [Myxococcota bacterium]
MTRARVRAFVLVLALLLPALRLLPIAVGHLQTDADRVFVGLGYIPKDFVSYAAFMAQARDEDRWLLRNEFTLEAQDGRYVLLLHAVVGRVARWSGLGIPVLWPALQWLGGAALLLAAWRFLGSFFPDPRARLLCYVWIGVGGGLEWLGRAVARWLPDAAADAVLLASWPLLGWNTFESLFHPVLVVDYTLLLLLLDTLVRRPRWGAALAFAVVPVTYAIHGYTAVGLGSILAFTALLLAVAVLRGRRERFPDLLAVGVAGSSFLIPLALSQWQSQDAVFQATSRVMAASSQAYPFWWWPLTFGALLPFGLWGTWRCLRSERLAETLLAGWVLAGLVLTHLPFFSPYKFLFLLHLPLCVAAVGALWSWPPARAFAAHRGRLVLAAALLVATNVLVTIDAVREVRTAPYFYLPRPRHEALLALRDLEPGPVMASPVTAEWIPWLSRKPVFLGQWFLSLSPRRKWEQVQRFYGRGSETAWRMALIERNQIRYVVYGPAERRLGALDPALPLRSVLAVGDTQVWEVVPPP